ncbi:ATP-binding cassette domain-containing protein [Marinicauda algicola]|uniref:ATP-binding cassette domain-containing protein n=1 Tax=Marinicauda algicola TaxID=2029849 RepID=A0A4S2H4N5_9PROT|nr:ATP-binding cassette domain-containing protein [Marinicauda algicola]TGY90371.1 ATP-binding cassette domain-containing protein [Marinicauda algicola]
MTAYALEVEGLAKSFAGKAAVREVSFKARNGEITGFLGPNGAGKTTTLRIALGIIRPDRGQVRLFGRGLEKKAFDRVGFLPEERGVYRKMTALEVITLFARLKGVPAREARERARTHLDRFGLADAAGKKIKELSKGMAQKVQIISAIVHEPDFIILDEPFSGLDPVNQAVLEDMIREQAEAGRTVLFSTHVMQHAERLCDRIVLMARGEKVFDGRVEEALAVVPRQVDIGVEEARDLTGLLSPFGSVTRLGPDEEGIEIWRVVLSGRASPQELLKACVDAGITLARFEPLRPHLHDAFVRLVADPADARPAEA